MIDRKEYDIQMDKARREQIKNISDYLNGFIQLNAKMREKPVSLVPDEDAIEYIKNISIPTKGRDCREVGDELVEKVFKYMMNLQHPRYLSFVPSAVSPYSLAGAVLTDIYNPNLAGYQFAQCAALLEEKLVKWMCSLAGFNQETCGGIFTSGGSLSNLTGMITARENKIPGRIGLENAVAFTSDQSHSSVVKGMKLLGLRLDQIIVIPSDDDYKLDPNKLDEAIQKEIAKGRKPFLVVANIGSTNTGEIDPLSDICDVAKKYDMWVHADGAFGGSILLSDIYRNYAKGIEKVDSFSWDLHKWSMQIYSCSVLLTKNKQALIEAYNEHPEYLDDIINAEHADGMNLGIEMSRPARCIKWWYTVQAMGTDAIADVIDYSFFNAETALKAFKKLPNWEIVSPLSCATFNVRYIKEGLSPEELNELNAKISKEILDDQYTYIVTTVLKGKKVLRLCFINSNTTTEDVLNIVERINEIATRVAK